MKKKYTVVCYCRCGCSDPRLVYHIEARSLKRSLKRTIFQDVDIIAVFGGHLMSVGITEN